ncbi:MAG: GNAT family N-acetyltransferase [Terracoccus sp.]
MGERRTSLGGSAIRAVRDYEPRDRAALYDVCLRTGASGDDATALYADPLLIGEVWVGPYVDLEPELALVVDAGAGAEGYVVGALDTRAFEARCEREWWPRLREEHPLPAPSTPADAHLVRLVHAPPRSPDAVVADHPSHLHINLLPRGQGGGRGRLLIEGLLERLAQAGSPGVHLGVGADNVRARGFYEHLGFSAVEVTPATHWLGRRLGRRLG